MWPVEGIWTITMRVKLGPRIWGESFEVPGTFGVAEKGNEGELRADVFLAVRFCCFFSWLGTTTLYFLEEGPTV